jgi:hypothetical protein
MVELTKLQSDLVLSAVDRSVFLSGPFGTGKTTTAIQLIHELIKCGSSPSSIFVLTPQRTLHLPYLKYFQNCPDYHGQPITFLTMGGLARRMISLYWPLLDNLAGFHDNNKPPSFLTMESAQYFMAHLVSPLLEKGYFSSLTLDRNRLYSQLLDDLNKSAIAGFPHMLIGEKLASAWIGDSSQLNVYENVQTCINMFRSFCLENNLLDYSLQIELFQKFIWPSRLFKHHFLSSYEHLIYDNCEEDPPFVHDLVKEWLPDLKTSLIIYDRDAGYRQFLGASPISAFSLQALCTQKVEFTNSFTINAIFPQLLDILTQPTDGFPGIKMRVPIMHSDLVKVMVTPQEELRFYPQMLEWVVSRTCDLVNSGVPPGEIAILAPYMSDMLRFELFSRLSVLNIPVKSNRPSRALRDEPVIQALLAFSTLAHPTWNLLLGKQKLANAFSLVVDGLDPVRSRLLVDFLLQISKKTSFSLVPFGDFPNTTRDRISYQVGQRYDQLRSWLENFDHAEPLDLFISRLFGELLSQPGFTFHNDMEAGRVTANLIESIQKFRWTMADTSPGDEFILGREYIKMVSEGVIAAQYINDWEGNESNDAVFLSPAYSFLIQNRSVDHQFWLDINSSGWYERLLQPLTHPYVLSADWTPGKKWDASDEMAVSLENLDRIISGLLRRCRKNIYLGVSNLNQSGSDERGLLTRKIQTLFRETIREHIDD